LKRQGRSGTGCARGSATGWMNSSKSCCSGGRTGRVEWLVEPGSAVRKERNDEGAGVVARAA
jgi:hypothetical protein